MFKIADHVPDEDEGNEKDGLQHIYPVDEIWRIGDRIDVQEPGRVNDDTDDVRDYEDDAEDMIPGWVSFNLFKVEVERYATDYMIEGCNNVVEVIEKQHC